MVVCVPILSVAYTYLIHYIPFIYANIVVTVGCGIGFGVLINFAAKLGKARNPIVVSVLSVVGVVLMSYTQWSVYVPLVFSDVYGIEMTLAERFAETVYLFARPGTLYELAQIINEVGVWTLFDAEFTGPLLLIIWILEFAVITVCAIGGSWGQARTPFSEESGEWYVELPGIINTIIPGSIDMLKRWLEDRNFAEFAQFVKGGLTADPESLGLTFLKPPQDRTDEQYYMNIGQQTLDKKNAVKATPLLKYVAIDAKCAEELIEFAQANAPAAPAPQAEG